MKIKIITDYPVAFSSPDYKMPWGTRRDSSVNRRFNTKIYNLFSGRFVGLLDLGCSGGGSVQSFIDDGHLGVGLEGSDYSKKMQRASWPVISEFLHTCDITKFFEVIDVDANKRILFDVVTAWEVMEHIAENDIDVLAENVRRHLKPNGLWIMSVSHNEEIINGIRLHQSVFPKEWWIKKFDTLGFYHHEEFVNYFNRQFVRDGKHGAPNSSHLVLTAKSATPPKIPTETISQRYYDRWLNSRSHKILKKIVVGV